MNNTEKRDVMRIQIAGTVRVITKDEIHIENAHYAFQEIHNMLLKQKNDKHPCTKYEQFLERKRLRRGLLVFKRSDITPESFETLSRYNACCCNFWLNEAMNEINIIHDEGTEYEFFISGKLLKFDAESGRMTLKVSQYIKNIPPLGAMLIADTFNSFVSEFIDEHLSSRDIITLERKDIRSEDIDILSNLPNGTVVAFKAMDIDTVHAYVRLVATDRDPDFVPKQDKSDEKKTRPIPIYIAGTVRILSDRAIAVDRYAMPNIDCIPSDVVDEFIVKDFMPKHNFGTCLGLTEDDVQYKELDKLRPYAGKFVRFAITPDAKIELYGESFAQEDKIESKTNMKGETVQLSTSANNITADIHVGSIKIKKNDKYILIKNATIAEFGETGVQFKGTAYSEDTENANWYTLLRNAAADYAVKKIKSTGDVISIDCRTKSTIDGTNMGVPVIKEHYRTQISVSDKNNNMIGISVVTCSEHDEYDRNTGVTEALANLAFDLKNNAHKFPNFFRRWFNAYQKRVMEAALKDIICPYCGKKFTTHEEQVECIQKHEAKREARRKAYEAVKHARLVRKTAEERLAHEQFEDEVFEVMNDTRQVKIKEATSALGVRFTADDSETNPFKTNQEIRMLNQERHSKNAKKPENNPDAKK